MKKNTSSNLTSGETSYTSTGHDKQEPSSPPKSSDSITFTVSKEKLDELKNIKQETVQNESVPSGLKTLSILSMIGSGFVVLMYLAIIVGIVMGLGLGGFAVIVFAIILIPFILKFIGALRMYKGKKSGYYMYMIPSIIMNSILVLSIVNGNQNSQLITAIFLTLIMIVFAVIFYNYKDQ